ncbi:HPt (histidine-containing phosphotransfer) domain-containing protein [Devosia lucknowensis]|uniref:HPt (Histidine-containing phosphotransfer) domain-containing protein n=1 Tax=Devosia lucknowensis TaxID=1096929 RepID=A0A1Y6EVX8_9HYPH|nr:Hpt domain-containing protein [Devosia lucknowensis]SMQ66855.1 HPt (histidine-containing phosphotransfer) domain-containing protein [Devosia lucknowensis]
MAQRAIVEHAPAENAKRPMRPVDLVHLAKQCLGDENLELEILRLFDTTLSTYFGRLKLSTSFDDLAINLHSIKGAAAGVGAWGVSDLATALEKDLKAGRPLAPERVGDLGMAVEEVRDFIARMLANEEV